MRCPACGQTIPETVRFCAYCGQEIAAPSPLEGSPRLELVREDGSSAESSFSFRLKMGETATSVVLVAKNGGGGALEATVKSSVPWLEAIDPASGNTLDFIHQAHLPQRFQIRVTPARDPSIGFADRRVGRIEIAYVAGGRRLTHTITVQLEIETLVEKVRRATTWALAVGAVLMAPYTWGVLLGAPPLRMEYWDLRTMAITAAVILIGVGTAGLVAAGRPADPDRAEGRMGLVLVAGLGVFLVGREYLAGEGALPRLEWWLLLGCLPWPLSCGLVRYLFAHRPHLRAYVAAAVTWAVFAVSSGGAYALGVVHVMAGQPATAQDPGARREVKQALAVLGYDLDWQDERWDARAARAWTAFQQDFGVPVREGLTEAGLARLRAVTLHLPHPYPECAITAVQRRLQAAGFSPGAADGRWGERTSGSLRRWQEKAGLAATGELNLASLVRLGVPVVWWLPGQWDGEFNGHPATLFITWEDGGRELAGTLVAGGVRESLAVGVGEGEQIVLRGTGYKRLWGSGRYHLDTLSGRMSADGLILQGTRRDTAGNTGEWSFRKVGGPPPPAWPTGQPAQVAPALCSLLGQWEGEFAGDPALLLVVLGREGGGVCATLIQQGYRERLTVALGSGVEVVLEGTRWESMKGGGSYSLDTLRGRLPEGRVFRGTFEDQAGQKGDWSFRKVGDLTLEPGPGP
ncbi:MAG: peptidoglycan-binding protein [Bacillota bacterium]